jgi:hypothetical protein
MNHSIDIEVFPRLTIASYFENPVVRIIRLWHASGSYAEASIIGMQEHNLGA